MTTSCSTLAGLRLLVVEDEAMVAMMIEDMLNELGCVVVDVAGTVSRGVALADDARLEIDGALLDVNLGGEAVYPVAEALAARGVPFIFSTGYSTAGVKARYTDVPILAKPYERSALEQQLMRAIRPSGPKGEACS